MFKSVVQRKVFQGTAMNPWPRMHQSIDVPVDAPDDDARAPEDVRVRPVRFLGRRQLARIRIREDQQQFLPTMKRVLSRYRMKRDAREFVIEASGQPVGYFQLNFCEREIRHYARGEAVCGLEAMCVDAAWQGRGIAVAALRQLPELVNEHCPHIHRVNLTVACDNRHAMSVYMRAGFRNTGKLLKIPNDLDQYVLTLALDTLGQKKRSK